MEITAKITGIEYKIHVKDELKTFNLKNFDINELPASFVLNEGTSTYAISKWVSPKRTRSYPYERVYNTLNFAKKITIIPIVKDEGFEGDRDFIQWDTISLMSLLDVYVILAYYDKAEKHKTRNNKITNQCFNNEYIKTKINEIKNYHSSALHWNIKEVKENLYNLLDKVKHSYSQIETNLNVKLHSSKGLENLQKQIVQDLNFFMDASRKKSKEAQSREIRTNQPKEFLKTQTKSKLTITNYLGGKYFLTIDELEIKNNTLYLVESKHSKDSSLPSVNDIKDGLLKIILFSNLKEVELDGKKIKCQSILNLTSSNLKTSIQSDSGNLQDFIKKNSLTSKQQSLIANLFKEANENNFTIRIGRAI
ncbi:MAG: hypothetical protein H7A23_11225 [Leptospiraceae bacterium]|nr:hypothetical protein [Leptospiraceae bacterium]